jgi:hypothetical protein
VDFSISLSEASGDFSSDSLSEAPRDFSSDSVSEARGDLSLISVPVSLLLSELLGTGWYIGRFLHM